MFEARARSFVWFCVALWGTLIILLFWRGAAPGTKSIVPGWNYQTIASYYVFYILISSFVYSHIEDDVANIDILLGQLNVFITKPFSYIKFKFSDEFSYRIIRTAYALITLGVIYLLFGTKFFQFSNDILGLILMPAILFLGYLIMFLFKMNLGVTAFWLKEVRALFELFEILIFILSGQIIPFALAPTWVSSIANIFPFAYVIYYPILILQGKIVSLDIIKILATQCFWVIVLYASYRYLWKMGSKKYSGVGA